MAGIQIPIGGDITPFVVAVQQLKAVMESLTATIRQTMAPAATVGRDMQRSMVSASTGATQATSGFKGLFSALSNVGVGMANIAAGAKGLFSAMRFLSDLPNRMQQVAGAARGVMATFNFLGKVAANWKKVATAAAGAAIAILGIVAAVKVVQVALSGLMSFASGVWRTIKSGANGAAGAVKGAFSSIGSAIPGGSMLGPLAGIAGIAGSIALIVSQLNRGIGLAGELERTGIALEALTGSGAGATAVLDEMRATWMRTGVSIAEQAGTIQKFLALGFAQDDAIKLNKNILDVAGAVGLSAAEASLLGSALAQVKAKGVVSMEELRQQIAEKGIPVIEALAAKMGVTQQSLIAMVSEGKVPAQDLLDLFLNMEGSFSTFTGGANRMGMSFLGLVNRLRGAWSLLTAEFAAPIIDALKPVLLDGIALVASFKDAAVSAGKSVGNALLAAFALIKTGKTFDLLKAGFAFAVTGAVDILMRGLRGAIAFLSTALPPIIDAAFGKLRDPQFWEGIGVFLRGAAAGFASEIRAALGQDALANSLRGQAKSDQALGGMLMGRAGDVDIGAVTANALSDGLSAAMEAVSGPASESFTSASAALKALLATVNAEVAALRAKAAVPALNQTPGSATGDSPAASAMGALKNVIGLTTSLGRVGGGGFGVTFIPMVSEQKKTNSLLTKVVNNTRNLTGGTPAIV